MLRKNRKLYLANVWPELITEKGVKLFGERGWIVSGNWLDGSKPNIKEDVIILAPASFDGALTLLPRYFPNSKIFLHLLFPDELVGWDLKSRKYLEKPNQKFIDLFSDKSLPIFSHSNFTTRLVLKTYPTIRKSRIKTTYLPVDVTTIINTPVRRGEKVKVLWNHAWRSDKGVLEAFEAVNTLTDKFPNVDFYIGKNRRWGSREDVEVIRLKAKPFLKSLKTKQNIYFVDTFDKHEDYLAFLRSFDIGFSTSYHEGFGLSMMEQAAAGVACVVPKKEVYPEVLPGALLYSSGELEKSISKIIEDKELRKQISRQCIDNATKYKVEDWVDKVLFEIQKICESDEK